MYADVGIVILTSQAHTQSSPVEYGVIISHQPASEQNAEIPMSWFERGTCSDIYMLFDDPVTRGDEGRRIVQRFDCIIRPVGRGSSKRYAPEWSGPHAPPPSMNRILGIYPVSRLVKHSRDDDQRPTLEHLVERIVGKAYPASLSSASLVSDAIAHELGRAFMPWVSKPFPDLQHGALVDGCANYLRGVGSIIQADFRRSRMGEVTYYVINRGEAMAEGSTKAGGMLDPLGRPRIVVCRMLLPA